MAHCWQLSTFIIGGCENTIYIYIYIYIYIHFFFFSPPPFFVLVMFVRLCLHVICLPSLLQEYTEEIERLKKDLFAAREKNGVFLSSENFVGMENKISSQKDLIKELMDKIKANVDEIGKVTTCLCVCACVCIKCKCKFRVKLYGDCAMYRHLG